MPTLFQTLLLILPFCGLGMSYNITRLSFIKHLYMDADNIANTATFLHFTARTQDRLIYFPPGFENEKLLEVPLGYLHAGQIITITVGLLKDHYSTGDDRDLQVGISDGTNYNLITIHDVNDYNEYPPCVVREGEDDNRLVSSGTQMSATFRLTFNPHYKYTACETAQDDGYRNTGRFNTRLDLTKKIYLHVNRDNSYEDYYFEYFLIEIVKTSTY